MSNFTFGHNVFKSLPLLLRQNASAGGKGLNTKEMAFLALKIWGKYYDYLAINGPVVT